LKITININTPNSRFTNGAISKPNTPKKLAKKLGRCHPGIYIMAISIKKQILQSTANLERKGT
jgi:hypothetical protein